MLTNKLLLYFLSCLIVIIAVTYNDALTEFGENVLNLELVQSEIILAQLKRGK